MSISKSYEMQLLEPVEKMLANIARSLNQETFEFHMQMLEAVASRLGGFSLEHYHIIFGIIPMLSYERLDDIGKNIVEALNSILIHPSLVLSALAREPLSTSAQRKVGAYYTDFRLAEYMAKTGKKILRDHSHVLDPACGTGILLVAVSIAMCGPDRKKASEWLTNSIFASDLSPQALRGARLALASLTNDLDAIRVMWSHWRVQDSLTASNEQWASMCPQGFDLIIGNPPWEKVKLTRHEFLNENGPSRHYGADYHAIDTNAYNSKRQEISDYAKYLRTSYSLLGSGEPDLYMAFLQLFSQLVCSGGKVVVLVPGGLIRSQGTEKLRRFLLENGRDVSITVMDNRARFFAIDTRFKFIALSYTRRQISGEVARGVIDLRYAAGTPNGMVQTGVARLGRTTLTQVRPDLTIPEVRNNREWRIFVSMMRNGVDWSDKSSSWYPEIVREVDMTRERPKFVRKPAGMVLPVVEGRMVQAHRFGAKAYVSGSGRRALWTPVMPGQAVVAPQFWIESSDLTNRILERSRVIRAGFCDIAGQTNERSMMASLIPAGVICGNKVPTVIFPNDPSEQRLLLWIGIVNSLPFDWMLRRVLTTTVNYFLLLGLPFPRLEPDTLPGRYIVQATRELREMDEKYDFNWWRMAELRANIDITVLMAYGLNYEELAIMIEDFPLLDRGQPPILGEKSSTITCDYLLLCAAKRFCIPNRVVSARVKAARVVGAVPYVSSEMVHGEIAEEKEV